MQVGADEFIRRFLMHMLPPGFQRILHFGFPANCHRTAKLALCRQLLIVPLADLLPPSADCRQLLDAIPVDEIGRCPHCGIGTIIRIGMLPPLDTS